MADNVLEKEFDLVGVSDSLASPKGDGAAKSWFEDPVGGWCFRGMRGDPGGSESAYYVAYLLYS